ncbi:MAG TPA: tetratricopeptide repeat protein [Candidatus Dormibacteraeota bacterium]|nr:tetratricopeptide repeat protein [Candidatus Dormibacteraeota bacterium]
MILALFLCVLQTGAAHSQVARTNDRDQQILQIQQLIRDHSLAGARQQLAEAAKKYPADAGFDNLLGIVEAQDDNYQVAEKTFLRAVERAPRFTGAYLNLGRLYQEHESVDPQARRKAFHVYERVLDYEPKNAEAHYQSAALLVQEGKYQESLAHLSHLPAESQSRAQTLSILCADYAGLDDRKRTEDAVAALLPNPDFSDADAQQALLGLARGKRDDLIVLLLEGLQKREPLPADLLHALGLAYEATGKLAESRTALEKSINLESPTVPSLFELARVERKQKDYEGSLGYLGHARDLEPRNAGIHYYFGLVCMDLNLLAEARNSFEKAVQIEPENADYNYAMGVTSTLGHDPAEAVPYFERYLKLKPGDPRGKLALGAALFRAKEYDTAVPRLKEAAMIRETATSAHYYLGAIALQERRLDEARSELEQALKSKPDYTDALAELGQYYLMQKNYSQAEKHLRRALDLDPDHYSANFYLLTLYTRTGDTRQEAQSKRFDDLKKLLAEKMQEFLRVVEVRPLETP